LPTLRLARYSAASPKIICQPFRAGFGSLRRFNAAFADLYGRSPSSLRAKVRTRREE
jgi:transcriptional regulator GlxA family with amidase domain